jgi:hypothetical protein
VDSQDHASLALWAADCAEHVLPYFEEKYPKDARPRRAVEAARAWARGEIRVGEARAASVAAHAAARSADEAGGTPHMSGHAPHAAAYAAKALTHASESAAFVAEEREWQYRRLPEHLRPVAFPAYGTSALVLPLYSPYYCLEEKFCDLRLFKILGSLASGRMPRRTTEPHFRHAPLMR